MNLQGIIPFDLRHSALSGSFVYRLILSSPTHFSPDQSVTFQTRNPTDTVQAIIVRSDDEGLVVDCQKPLPTDAKLLSLSFDPSFILRALEKFVLEMAPNAGPIARLVFSKTIDARLYDNVDFHVNLIFRVIDFRLGICLKIH